MQNAVHDAPHTPKKRDRTDRCELCGREQPLTFHHLIPRRNHTNKWFKKRFSMSDMTHRGLWLCRACHKKLHATFTEKELGRRYNTKEAILAEPEIERFLAWVRKQR